MILWQNDALNAETREYWQAGGKPTHSGDISHGQARTCRTWELCFKPSQTKINTSMDERRVLKSFMKKK